nr:probable sulfate transporter 3.5 [Tanacetum cinerariifolium]
MCVSLVFRKPKFILVVKLQTQISAVDYKTKNLSTNRIVEDWQGVTSIDITGVEALVEIRRSLEVQEIQVVLVNPRHEVMEKLIVTKFIDKIGKEHVFLSIEDAVEGCRFSLTQSKDNGN